MTKGQLHQLLAAESDLAGKANRLAGEAAKTFSKGEHFLGHTKALKMFDDSRANEETTEIKQVDSTVRDKLDFLVPHIVQAWDAFLQKEATNQTAKSDVVLDDGNILLEDMPVTALLGLETRLKTMRQVYGYIPTLAPGVSWEKSNELNVFESRTPDERFKTEKSFKVIQLAKATKEHKEQVEKVAQDVPVGKWTDHRRSGMISPATKSLLLERIDEILIAVKKARMQANCAEVKTITMGEKIFDHINQDLPK